MWKDLAKEVRKDLAKVKNDCSFVEIRITHACVKNKCQSKQASSVNADIRIENIISTPTLVAIFRFQLY